MVPPAKADASTALISVLLIEVTPLRSNSISEATPLAVAETPLALSSMVVPSIVRAVAAPLSTLISTPLALPIPFPETLLSLIVIGASSSRSDCVVQADSVSTVVGGFNVIKSEITHRLVDGDTVNNVSV